ncbi:MAG: sulfotransferase [Ilumatobacteraceae bacterium]
MRLPDFLVIGGYKCGSTSLHEYLRAHPDIFVPERKEPNYLAFDGADPTGPETLNPAWARSVQTLPDYAALFESAPANALLGEVSPEYLTHPLAAERIAARLPDVKLVAVLRDPVRRAFSDFCMNLRDGREPESEFAAALDDQDRRAAAHQANGFYLSTGFYGEQLQRYFRHFPAHQIHVMLAEDLRKDRDATLRALYGFLGVRDVPNVVDGTEHNRSGVPSNPAAAAAYRLRNGVGRRIGPLVPTSLKRRIDDLLQRGLATPEFRAADQARLADVYRADVAPPPVDDRPGPRRLARRSEHHRALDETGDSDR